MRILPPKLTIAFVAAFSSPALADSAQWCLDAYEQGDIEYAERMARMVLNKASAPNSDRAEDAIECLRRSTGDEYMYHEPTGNIVLADDYPALVASEEALAEEQRAQREAELEEQKRAAEEVAAREAMEREEQLRLEKLERDFQMQIERERAEKRHAVMGQLGEACERLFRRDPHNTITNRLCYDYFMQVGLPD